MRLIDADALIEKAWDADTRVGYVQVVDVGDILDAPTIEPQCPKGEWILKKELVPLAWDCTPMDYDNYDEETHCELKGFYHCSRCDWKSGEFKGGNFCPVCGADMRGLE